MNGMTCKFRIQTSINKDELYSWVVTEVRYYNALLDGDQNEGSFNIQLIGGSFIGSYKVIDKNIEVEIVSKPLFIPCSTIEKFLINQLS